MTNGTGRQSECNYGIDSNNGFRVENLVSVIQIVTDAIAVRYYFSRVILCSVLCSRYPKITLTVLQDHLSKNTGANNSYAY